MSTAIKHFAHYISKGVILERYPTSDDPDQVGSAAFWDEKLKQLQRRLPFEDYWRGLKIKIIHGDSPYLDWLRQNGKQGLEDYDLNTPGCQGAAGLFFDKTNEGLHLAIFPSGHNPDRISPNPLTPQQLYDARETLDHELGHFLAWMIEYGPNSQKYICRQITKNLDQLMPLWVSPGQSGERLAECYRAWMGSDSALGKTSDNRSLPAANYQRAATLLICSYWLVGNLSGLLIDGFEAGDTRCSWDEYEWIRPWWSPFTPQLQKTGRFAVDRSWTKTKL